MKAKLVLKDGTKISGHLFGASKTTAGEIVFSTAMTGYIEALTDPSYFGQILVLTYPLVGNYGVPKSAFFQSKKIQVAGLVISCLSKNPSHYQSQNSLSEWLKKDNVPGISGIDTRALTQKIRQKGTMLGKIETDSQKTDFYDPNKDNLVAKVSIRKPKIYKNKKNKKTILLIDCGCKRAIIKSFLKRNINVLAVPWDYDPFKSNSSFQGIVFSNGPGNPQMADKTIKTAQQALKAEIPCLGICLGNQILALAAGAQTYKLKFGHRSLNQPVKNLLTHQCFITSQNHGFAIDQKTLPSSWRPWFLNLNDQTCEGIISENNLFMAVQFHPEGHPGPEDTNFIFDEFSKKI